MPFAADVWTGAGLFPVVLLEVEVAPGVTPHRGRAATDTVGFDMGTNVDHCVAIRFSGLAPPMPTR